MKHHISALEGDERADLYMLIAVRRATSTNISQ